MVRIENVGTQSARKLVLIQWLLVWTGSAQITPDGRTERIEEKFNCL